MLRRCLDPVPGAWPRSELRRAAVLAPVTVLDGREQLLLVARPAALRRHGGQIGFPGGMRDGDEDPVRTALRECDEELGIAAARLDVLGSLPACQSSSGIDVLCLVGRLRPGELRPDANEVERVLHVPLDELRDAARWTEAPPPIGATGRQPRLGPHFRHGDELLWGLTARFVRELVARLA